MGQLTFVCCELLLAETLYLLATVPMLQSLHLLLFIFFNYIFWVREHMHVADYVCFKWKNQCCSLNGVTL